MQRFHSSPETDSRTSEELFVAFRDGDAQAFDELFHRHNADLVARLARKVGDFQLAEDFASEAWSNAARNRHSFDANQPFLRWLFIIAQRKSITEFQRGKVWIRGKSNVDFYEGKEGADQRFRSPDEAVSCSEIQTVVRRAVSQLQEADLATSCLLDGLSYAEAAGQHGLTTEQVRKKLRFARRKLSIALEEYRHL